MTTVVSARAEVTPSVPNRGRRVLAHPLVPVGALLAACVLARVPALINHRGVHSDAAIVGLQAMHILDGEWSWFLWGAGYQASFDALLIALAFAITGPSTLTLMVVPLIGHLILVGLVYDLLRRAVSWRCALIACLPLVFAPQSINGVALYAPRQWSITAVILAAWLAGCSLGRRHAWLWLAGSAFFAGFAVYLDLFTMVMIPGVALLALWCAGPTTWPTTWPTTERKPLMAVRAWLPELLRTAQRLGGLLAGAALGGAIVLWSQAQPVFDDRKAELLPERFEANWNLLVETCLPYLFGLKVFSVDGTVGAEPWHAPWPYAVVQWLGVLGFAAASVWALVVQVNRKVPRLVRQLGAVGLVVSASAIGGFLVSSMPVDLLSTRYLAPIIWFAPFTLAPAAYTLGARRFGVAIASFIVAVGVGGWIAFGPYVQGPLPVQDPRGVAADEAALGDELRARGIHHAAAQYWLSYRLGFLFDEDPVVVPLDEPGNRYRPYWTAFQEAPVAAYLFHPSEPRATPEQVEPQLRQAGQHYERLELHGFTVLVVHR